MGEVNHATLHAGNSLHLGHPLHLHLLHLHEVRIVDHLRIHSGREAQGCLVGERELGHVHVRNLGLGAVGHGLGLELRGHMHRHMHGHLLLIRCHLRLHTTLRLNLLRITPLPVHYARHTVRYELQARVAAGDLLPAVREDDALGETEYRDGDERLNVVAAAVYDLLERRLRGFGFFFRRGGVAYSCLPDALLIAEDLFKHFFPADLPSVDQTNKIIIQHNTTYPLKNSINIIENLRGFEFRAPEKASRERFNVVK
mmetsp:Transcript_26474/g.50165  ORF Transcript_26474/g.50165 Transcript_26474/m.50165 type:complete len:256 (+) Transcript_26474:736-1503(+)